MAEIEQRIEENEERLRLAIETTQLGTWEWYPLTGKLNWSPECKRIYGLDPDAEVDFSVFADHIVPADKDMVTDAIEAALDPDGGGNYDVTYRIIRFDDKSIRWIHPKGKVFFNKNRQAERFIGTVVDISVYKAFEDSLRENEQRARLAIDAANMGTFDWDLTENRFFSSTRLLEIFGFGENEEDVSHTDLIGRIHPDDKAVRDRAVKDALTEGGLEYEARVIWPDQSVHWVRVYGKLSENSEDEIKRMYGIAMDITEEKSQEAMLQRIVAEKTLSLMQSNQELKKSEERYARMAEEVQDYAILLLSTEGIVLNWNKGAERIKGYKESEIVGKNFRIFYRPVDQQDKLPDRLLHKARTEGRAMHEGWRVRKDGTTFWGSIVITALHDDQNNVIGFTKVTRDLTERKLAEDKLQQYTKELEAQNKELEQFAYIASHDLQEPMRKIQTFTEVLDKNIDEPAVARKYLEKINSSASRMSQLIRSVLEYSRLSVTYTVMEPVDLNTTLENVKTDFELLISERKVEIRSSGLPVVKGVPLQLHQLFANLIGNAIKFSEKNPVVEISARKITAADPPPYPGLRAGEKYTEITVADNGIGFDQKYASKIFTIFQRLHGQKAYPGTGIGLALCKKIVENHYGAIGVESEPGKGTKFFVYLPDNPPGSEPAAIQPGV